MRSKRRLIAALAVAVMCAPGTFVRSEVPLTVRSRIDIAPIAAPRSADTPGWAVAGVWHYTADSTRFGGFSALSTLGPDGLRAFSDRGFHMTITAPEQPGKAHARLNRQLVQPGMEWDLWDIESVTRDPATGTYWLGFEHLHTIHRFTIASAADGLRDLTAEVDWPQNAGIEAMVRLDDGRFVILPEDQNEGLLFAGDPVAGGAPQRFGIRVPGRRFAITAAQQLPDGRLMVLLRKVVWPSSAAWPPFASALAIGDVPRAGGVFAPQIVLRLDDLLPRENYEGLALRPQADGRIAVWLIADDNISVFQRTLLAKLLFTP